MLSFVNTTEFGKFKLVVDQYCKTMNYHDLKLTNDEYMQLFGFMDDKQVTPEARGDELAAQLHFEIKRGLARRYSFELLLRDEQPSEDCYKEFTQAQALQNRLSFRDFSALSLEARALDSDVKALIRVSCFLYMNHSLKQTLKKHEYTLSTDSEEFLSQFASAISLNEELSAECEATKALTVSQRQLFPKMFWLNMHFRHMLYTEGGDSMTKTFSDAVAKGDFSKQDFLAWKWRWLTNLFGFQSGPAAKYYDSNLHFLAATIVVELEKILTDAHYSYLDHYLLKRAELAGFNEDVKTEQQLLGHIAAYCNQVNVITPGLGKAILAGYNAYKAEFNDSGELALAYTSQRKDMAAITPTYVPAVINSAYVVFKTKFNMTETDSLKHASQFTCQVLSGLYALPHDKRISCMNLAKEANLQVILAKWLENHRSFEFAMNDACELVAKERMAVENKY